MGQAVKADHEKWPDFQLLSNDIWWEVAILDKPLSSVSDKVKQLVEEFDNKILPYRPLPWKEEEVHYLIVNGFVIPSVFIHNLIMVRGKVIGEMLRANHPCWEKLKTKTQ